MLQLSLLLLIIINVVPAILALRETETDAR